MSGCNLGVLMHPKDAVTASQMSPGQVLASRKLQNILMMRLSYEV